MFIDKDNNLLIANGANFVTKIIIDKYIFTFNNCYIKNNANKDIIKFNILQKKNILIFKILFDLINVVKVILSKII
jgi:hypothetical protein